MTDAINDTCGPNRDPQHLHGKNRDADDTKQQHIQQQHQQHAKHAVTRIEIPLYPVIRGAMPIARQRLLVGSFGAV